MQKQLKENKTPKMNTVSDHLAKDDQLNIMGHSIRIAI